MRTWNKSTARAALLTASFVAVGAGSVCPQAAFGDTTSGDHSVLGGNQVNIPISVPIDISGNSIAVAGAAGSRSKGGATVGGHGDGGGSGARRTSGRHSIGGGNQVNVPVSIPVNVCGNGVAVLGRAFAGCKGGAKTGGHGHGGGSGGGRWTSGYHSALGGNQVNVPVSIPVNVCGNAVGNAFAGCKGGAAVDGQRGSGGQWTSGDHSVLGGNQVDIPVKAPVNVCGNGAAVLGDAVAGCAGGAGGHAGHGGYGHGGYDHGRYGAAEHGDRVRRLPAATVLRGLPVVSRQAKAVSLSQGTTMPALPPLPASGTHGHPRFPILTGQITRGLPGKVGHTQAARSVARGLPKPPAGTGLTPPRADVRDPFGPVTKPVTGMVPMAAGGLPGDDTKAGLTYILTVGALLAGAAAAMACSRRIRFGRR
ncbi:MAG TPA: chaplin family protein [Actinomadura sp.]|jgi:hypothetical protein|nr:chaplin family protein [Actinomadura sp.]